MDEEAYKIMANIKYSTSYLFLDRTQKELIKRYMRRYEALHGIRAARMDNVCPDCGHSLVDNEHGPDQNDFRYDFQHDQLIYLGSCTYCKECQRLAASNNKFEPTRK